MVIFSELDHAYTHIVVDFIHFCGEIELNEIVIFAASYLNCFLAQKQGFLKINRGEPVFFHFHVRAAKII
jgi:hypothetical protein